MFKRPLKNESKISKNTNTVKNNRETSIISTCTAIYNAMCKNFPVPSYKHLIIEKLGISYGSACVANNEITPIKSNFLVLFLFNLIKIIAPSDYTLINEVK